MPELPEVEVVRRGLEKHAVGRRIESATIRGERVARRHLPGPRHLEQALTGTRFAAAERRGKYLWLTLDSGEALVTHLGMSGQFRVAAPDAPLAPHTHGSFVLDDGTELRFIDQRTFGGLFLDDLVADAPRPADAPARLIPATITHIAPDPLEPAFDLGAVVAAARRRHSAAKRAILDQSLVSGIGNIYADEALWQAKVHGERPTDRLTRPAWQRILTAAQEVMTEALDQGGTSFDSLYVNVNGESGYFARSLHAYGREGTPCDRCGTLIRRASFMNRSSYFCPRCQRQP